jgi:hypothetical protein
MVLAAYFCYLGFYQNKEKRRTVGQKGGKCQCLIKGGKMVTLCRLHPHPLFLKCVHNPSFPLDPLFGANSPDLIHILIPLFIASTIPTTTTSPCQSCTLATITLTPGDPNQGTTTPTTPGVMVDGMNCNVLTVTCTAQPGGQVFMQVKDSIGHFKNRINCQCSIRSLTSTKVAR